jgi:protein-S-isoprenylcysteine O-methyltransferase Ste14
VLLLVGTAVLLGIGVVLLVTTVSLFAKIGRGTLAPWNPPQHLVVVGPYRYVRNPMISGVLFILLAEAVFFGSLPLLGMFAVAFIVNAIYIPLVEERGLERRFGEEYRRYKQHVPRWIPRLTPYSPK